MRRLLGSVGIWGLLVGLAAPQVYAQSPTPTAGPTPGIFSLAAVNSTDCSLPVVNIETTEAGATLGFDFDITFNDPNAPSVLTVANVTIPSGALTEGCLFEFNDATPGLLSLSIACTSPIVGDGVIAAIDFDVAAPGSTTPEFAECKLDEEDCPMTSTGLISISGCPAVNLSTGGQGSFGLSPGRGCISGFLAGNGAAVASATTELTFDSPEFAISGCSINAVLTPLGKTLSRTTLGPGHERITVSGGNNTIPTGQLFGCTLTIAAGQSVGPYVIENLPSASNAASDPLPTTGVDGVVNVTGCASDCNGDGEVRIAELQRISGIFLGDPLCSGSDSTRSCPNADMVNNDGQVTIQDMTRSSCLLLAGTCSITCSPP